MAQVGQTIEHPITGERMTFLETAASTDGEYMRVRMEVCPGGSIPNLHVHPLAEEKFEVTAGQVQFRRAKESWVAQTGETVVVPPGTAHVWGNPFDEPATLIIDLRPALRAETFFETFFGLARDGEIDAKRNMPKSFLQAMLLAHDYRDEIRLPGLLGSALLRLAALLAPLAYARGYRSRYPEYSDLDSP